MNTVLRGDIFVHFIHLNANFSLEHFFNGIAQT